MSAVTLETLKADFVAAKREVANALGRTSGISADALMVHLELFQFSPDDVLISDEFYHITPEMRRTAEIYTIARDQGLEAAMLWKLSN